MPYTDEQMQQAAATLEEASLKVRAGLLLIGEDHREPHGRGLVANLIRRGLIDDLFLEVASNDGLEDDDVGSPAWFQRNNNTDLRTNPEWDPHQVNGTHPNHVPLSRLVEFAVLNGVRVHMINYVPAYGQPFLDAKGRSNFMRTKLDQLNAGPRSVFLVGSAHLKHTSLKDRPNVQMVRCIGA